MDILTKLKDIFQKASTQALSNVMQTKSDSVIGVDIGTSAIKVVQIKKREGRAVLETYGAIALGPYADLPAGKVTNLENEKLIPAITELFSASGINTKATAFAIPSAASLIFVVEIPQNLSEKEYDSVIQTEARKFIPVPIAEVTLDWWVIPDREAQVGPEGESDGSQPDTTSLKKKEALVVAIHNDTLTRYQELVTTLGLTDPVFEIEVFSSIRANFGHELSPILIFDMGASKTKLSIVEHGVVRTFHVVNRGSHDISNALATSLAVPFEKAEELKRTQGLLVSNDPKVADVIRASIDYIFMEANSVVLDYERKQN